MAIKGDVGKIMFENAGGTEADVGQTRSWSLSITKDTMETTKQGDTFKTNIGGLISGEGTAELLYNPSETGAGYTTFIDDVLTTGNSFNEFADEYFKDNKPSVLSYFGWVVFARGEPQHWVKSLFQMPYK